MHWIYPSVGGALFGFGLGSIGDASLTLVIDSYRDVKTAPFVFVQISGERRLTLILDYWRCFYSHCIPPKCLQHWHSFCYHTLDRTKWAAKYVYCLRVY